MAEIKTGIFAKNVQKRLNRAQEKVLQKLGKADETKDEQFEQCVQNFKRQESEGSRLQREMKAYLAAVKAMQQASMNLTESLHEVYEPDWYGKDDVMTIGKNCDALWEDFHQRLVDSSLITLDTYLAQFPDIKTRVSKRSRKLIDYDSARHHLETLQASTIRNERKIAKAEEELKKAQKVFDDFNVDLQLELPTLWDSRVGFYVNTFKNVTHLESKFHREISVLCLKLYEVMKKLAEQHSDKMFTIQGAPSDSGPLRFARTPTTTPPDESPPESPEASPNHMLAPGPYRPKSPSVLKKGPPVPPPPKITPTAELHQEQIISLFDSSFAPDAPAAPAPAAQAEKAVDSLLDLDFDPFKPDAATPIGQSQSPMSQSLPWDLWTAPAAEVAQPPDSLSVGDMVGEEGSASHSASDFPPSLPEQGASDWAADFSSLAAGSEAGAAGESAEAQAAEGQGWPPAEGWGTEVTLPPADTAGAETAETEAAEPEATEPETAEPETAEPETAEHKTAEPEAPGAETAGPETVESEVSGWDVEQSLDPIPVSDPFGAGAGEAEVKPEGEETSSGGGGEGGDQAMPGIVFTDEHGQEMQDVTEGSELGLYPAPGAADASRLDWGLSGQTGSDWSGSEYETADEWAESVGRSGGCWASAQEELPVEDARVTTGGATEQPSLDGSAGERGGFVDQGAGGQADPVQKRADEQIPGPGSESWFQAAEPAVPSAGTGPMVPGDADPFEAADVFAALKADLQADPFSQAGGTQLVLDFVSDPFAEPPGGAGGGWTSDPFANDSGQSWPGNWAPAAGGGDWAFPSASEGQPNGLAQWDAFPSGEGGAPGSDSPWQEVSGSSGFFSSSGQGEFTANWGAGDQDPSAALPGGAGPVENKASSPVKGHPTTPGTQSGAQGPQMDTIEAARWPKDTESSDLSEDEVTNRRYGKLYQEVDTEKEEVSNNALNGVSQPDAGVPEVSADSNQSAVDTTSEAESAVAAAETEVAAEAGSETGEAQGLPAAAEASEASATEEKAADATEVAVAVPVASPEAESPEITLPSDAEVQPSDEAALETATTGEAEVGSPTAEAPAPTVDKESPKEQIPNVEPGGGKEITLEGAEETEAKEEKMPIPSVVIEPASSNEGDDDRDGDITSPTVSTGNGVTPESQPETPVMPTGFLYKVETLHDFEAANSDELELKRGDVVLVVPTANVEDQDAGWLTGIKECDWLQQGATAQKGLFPENFTQRAE